MVGIQGRMSRHFISYISDSLSLLIPSLTSRDSLDTIPIPSIRLRSATLFCLEARTFFRVSTSSSVYKHVRTQAISRYQYRNTRYQYVSKMGRRINSSGINNIINSRFCVTKSSIYNQLMSVSKLIIVKPGIVSTQAENVIQNLRNGKN